jgi:hypothetical protein
VLAGPGVTVKGRGFAGVGITGYGNPARIILHIWSLYNLAVKGWLSGLHKISFLVVSFAPDPPKKPFHFLVTIVFYFYPSIICPSGPRSLNVYEVSLVVAKGQREAQEPQGNGILQGRPAHALDLDTGDQTHVPNASTHLAVGGNVFYDGLLAFL